MNKIEWCTATKKHHCYDPTTYCTEHHCTEPEPIRCKWCGSTYVIKHGIDNGTQKYLCLECRREFSTLDAPYGMHTTVEQIGASLAMYYTGLSLSDIVQFLKQAYDNEVERSTVYRWLIRFTKDAIGIFEEFKPKVSDTWIADETAIKFQDKLYWIWDIIDRDTRFLLASYLSPNRGAKQAQILMERASKRADTVPKNVITDGLLAYLDGIELAFGADTKHIQSTPFAEIDSTNIIERFQGTIKERTKVIWGFKTPETANIILQGFLIHYNFFRPHLALENHTPAEAAKIKLPFKNWAEFVRKAGGIL
ncbi:MAG: IS6 family transposase [Dehalococcoidia bacterium]